MMQLKTLQLIACISFSTVLAQTPATETIMTINNRAVLKSEFEAVYRKNNPKGTSNQKNLNEYVELFSLFKSKVFEAERLGLDTLRSFKNELSGYRRQLAAPYLTDKNTNEQLLREAFERLQTEIRASHILVRIDENALPKDTIEAWTRISLIRNAVLGKLPTTAEIAQYEKLLKNTSEVQKLLKGKDSSLYHIKLNAIKSLSSLYSSTSDPFHAIAPKTSDDPSVVDNKGDLNYFTAFDMVYPFESSAYNTKTGALSTIVRSKFGYHIIKVEDRRPYRGEIFVAHIMCKFPKNANDVDRKNARLKLDSIALRIKNGARFEDEARRYSDDRQSADRGGQLQPFKSGRYAKAFEDAAFALEKNEQVSDPVETPFGWHIIKRIELKRSNNYEEIKSELKLKVSKDSRSQMGRKMLIARVKSENNFKAFPKALDEFSKVVDSTFLKATWQAKAAEKLGNKTLFTLGNKAYTQNDFAKYLESQMTFRSTSEIMPIVKQAYVIWENEQIVAFEDAQLEFKNTDFANLYREYRDGILLFDLTDQMVWSRAIKDTLGLKSFFTSNASKYQWDERAEVTIYYCPNEKTASEVRALLKKNTSQKALMDKFSKSNIISASEVQFLKGENKMLDAAWKPVVLDQNISDSQDKKVLVYHITRIIPKTLKTFGECKGMLTADYQAQLDKDWLEYLKSTYKVSVNQAVLKTIEP